MQVGAFELREPLPELNNPHFVLSLRPWVDVGSVGTLALGMLEKRLSGADLGQLRRPSNFYDMTRYRPTLFRPHGGRRVELPNSFLRAIKRADGQDMVFLHALEPHLQGEEFVESIAAVMEVLDAQRFAMVGAMYGPAPHTRPLRASGGSTDPETQAALEVLGVHSSSYEGPTSVVSLIHEDAARQGLSTLTMLVQLPSYAQLDEDAMGQYTLLRLLDHFYHFGLDLEPLKARGERQYQRLDEWAQRDPRLREAIKKLESVYDSEAIQPHTPRSEAELELSPEIERFLRHMERRGQGEGD